MGAGSERDGTDSLNFEERVARDHLTFLGYEDVQPHPNDRNSPPDLLINGTVAVELRRLNQNERGSDTPKGLDETDIPLLDALLALLGTFDEEWPTRWHVTVAFRRPLPKRLRTFKKRLRALLQRVLDQPDSTEPAVMDEGNIHVEVVRRPPSARPTFTLRLQDLDRGAWVLDEYQHSLGLCIPEKSRVTAEHRAGYSEWWLILVDDIVPGALASEETAQDFRARVSVESRDWNRVIIVNKLDHRQGFDL